MYSFSIWNENVPSNQIISYEVFEYTMKCVKNFAILFLLIADGGNVDTHRSYFSESGRNTTRYLRILRVGYAKPYRHPLPPEPPIRLNYVTFEPQKISSGGITGIPLYESMGDTMKRAMVWLARNNGKS